MRNSGWKALGCRSGASTAPPAPAAINDANYFVPYQAYVFYVSVEIKLFELVLHTASMKQRFSSLDVKVRF